MSALESLSLNDTEVKEISPERLLTVYDVAIVRGDLTTIASIADYSIARVSDYGQGYKFNEVFAICDSAILSTGQQG